MPKTLAQKLNLSEEQVVKIIKELTDQDKSCVHIASVLNINATTIRIWMKRFDIKRRSNLRSKEWLLHNYLFERKSACTIAKELNVTDVAVIWYLKKVQNKNKKRSRCSKN